MATDRRHVAKGPLTDFLVERAADAYVGLLAGLPRTPKLLDLVPGLMGKGELDARIRRAILRRLPDAPLLPVLSPPAVQTPSFADQVYEPDAEWRSSTRPDGEAAGRAGRRGRRGRGLG